MTDKVQKIREEDEKYNNIVVSALYNPSIEGLYNFHKINRSDVITWFKALKDRVLPKPAEWSEEDDDMLNLIISRLHSHPNVDLEEYLKEYNWLNYRFESLIP